MSVNGRQGFLVLEEDLYCLYIALHETAVDVVGSSCNDWCNSPQVHSLSTFGIIMERHT